MILGMFYIPAIMGGTMLFACLVSGFFVFRKTAKKSTRIRGGCAIALVLLFGAVFAIAIQSTYRDADATIRARLSDINVSLVSYQGVTDSTVVVKAQNGCTARYQLAVNGVSQGVWPLVPGSGYPVSDCGGQDLDKLFFP